MLRLECSESVRASIRYMTTHCSSNEDKPSPGGCVQLGIMSTASVTRHLLGVMASLRQTEENPYVSVAAVSSRDIHKATEFAEKHGIPKAFGSHDELLADPAVDAVYVAMPNHAHAEWIIRALNSNKHVLCEKPFVLSADEAQQVADAHKRCMATRGRPLIVMEAVMSLYTPLIAHVERLLATQVIGDVQYMRGVFQYNMTRDSFRSGPSRDGGGSLWDVGCYPVYLARHLLGADPVRCAGSAVWSSTDEAVRYDKSFSGMLTFPSGACLHVSSSLHTPLAAASFEIHGSKGSIVLKNPFKPTADDGITLHLREEEGCGNVVERIIPPTSFEHRDGRMHDLDLRNPYHGELRTFCCLVERAKSADPLLSPGAQLEFSIGQARCMEELYRCAWIEER